MQLMRLPLEAAWEAGMGRVITTSIQNVHYSHMKPKKTQSKNKQTLLRTGKRNYPSRDLLYT